MTPVASRVTDRKNTGFFLFARNRNASAPKVSTRWDCFDVAEDTGDFSNAEIAHAVKL